MEDREQENALFKKKKKKKISCQPSNTLYLVKIFSRNES